MQRMNYPVSPLLVEENLEVRQLSFLIGIMKSIWSRKNFTRITATEGIVEMMRILLDLFMRRTLASSH